MEEQTYSEYFNIDPEFSPAINAEIFKNDPDKWKKYYPHESFKKFLKTMISVLGRKQKLSIWVEGVYGTGKSYSILTMKKLIDSSPAEVEEYFSRFNIDRDLYNQLENLKQGGKIITVHRTGSSMIHDDYDLCLAIQESIEKALETAGVENRGNQSWRDAAIEHLSNEENRKSFNIYAQGSYRSTFAGKTAEEILIDLQTIKDDSILPLMQKLIKFKKIQNVFTLTIDQLSSWINEVIENNNLRGLVFFWDEFTEYFRNNSRNLTGFQQLCELSQTVPFYFVIVTHISSGIFSEGNQDFKKINDRFVSPHSEISLPDGIAFELLANALEKNNFDPHVKDEWKNIVQEQSMRTHESRKKVISVVKGLKDSDLAGILPIQPYAALVLKQIASNFNSNQRSMFDFIQGGSDPDTKSFQWFIDNTGPFSDNSLLTINYLWDYFYEKNRNGLAPDIKNILDYYVHCSRYNLDPDELEILKTTLLLQAISYHLAGTVDVFIPTEQNINLSFEGTYLENDAQRILEKLVRDKILFKKTIGKDQEMYNSRATEIDNDEIEKLKKDVDRRTTWTLIEEEFNGSRVKDFMPISGALKLRYELINVSTSIIDVKVREAQSKISQYQGKIITFVCYSKDEVEKHEMEHKITHILGDDKYDKSFVFIDCLTTFGVDDYQQYRDAIAQYTYLRPKDHALADQFLMSANECLNRWKTQLYDGQFVVYSTIDPKGRTISNINTLIDVLKSINEARYRLSLETQFDVPDTLYDCKNLPLGAQCGIDEKTAGVYKVGNKNLSLENALCGAFGIPEYWKKDPSLFISKIKTEVDSLIEREFKQSGRISIREIYSLLKSAPYGFMPCNLTAFILGFLLKEYKNGNYSYSDNIIATTLLDANRLKEMIEGIIKLQNNNDTRYKDKYIVALTDEEKAFISASSTIFEIPTPIQDSVENIRSQVRSKLKDLSFPAWVMNYDLDSYDLKNSNTSVEELINLFCGIANNDNLPGSKTDIEVARSIGKKVKENPSLTDDLKLLFSSPNNCTNGMRKYIQEYHNGELSHLAQQIDDNEKYITILHDKFSVDAAKWVWNKDTANEMIEDTIIEYRILKNSRAFNITTTSYRSCISEWIEKCNYIRVPFQALEPSLKDIRLMQIIYEIKRTNNLCDHEKKTFSDALSQDQKEFSNFYDDQIRYFKEIAAFYIEGLDDGDVEKIFSRIPIGTFTWDKHTYFARISEIVKAYNSNQLGEDLRRIWKEKSGTDNPIKWSEKYTLPPTYMVYDKDYTGARECFNTICSKNASDSEIKNAIAFLNETTFRDDLKNPTRIDDIFRECIIGEYSVILTDINSVKQYLLNYLKQTPYYWDGCGEIKERMKKLAESEYHKSGVEKALEKIERMPIDELKRYLKQQIEDNVSFGLQIIKDE